MVSFVFCLIALFANTIQSETKTCTAGALCQCVEDELCELQCIGLKQCEGTGTTLLCRSGHPCTITCSGMKACISANINANGASTLSIQCDGSRSCEETVINCNNANNCDTICSDDNPASCGSLQLDCSTSMCVIDCETQNTCDAINISTEDAASFQCSNNCPDTVPSAFIRTTIQPTHTTTTNIQSLISTETVTNHPSASVSSIDTSSTSSTDTVTNYPSVSVTDSSIKSTTNHISSTSSDTTELQSNIQTEYTTKGSISTLLYSSQPLVSTATMHDDIVLIATHMHEEEQKVMETTYVVDIESTDELDSVNNQYNDIELGGIWIYVAIGAAVFSCLLIVLIYTIGVRKRSSKEAFKEKAYVPKYPVIHLAIPSTTVTMTPVSQSGSSVALTPATMTPVTPEKIRNLSIIKDDIQYTNTFPDTVNNGLSMYLANGVLASSIVMDDIVNDMVSTPGDDNMGIDPNVAIEMNPMEEGDLYIKVNDDYEENEMGNDMMIKEDNDDIVGAMSTYFLGESNADSNYSEEMDNIEMIQ